ncbi:hypothetical protein [Candidatus Magnetominusculus dajiuhuensis]|uniref:hypothetical protein n=1 Tax=Candidatus Magnetominusculus dajiuhuensis TaxID=3137712 RepID=UPI003B42DC4D
MVIKREIRRQPDIFDEDRYFQHVIATNSSEEEKTGYEVIQGAYPAVDIKKLAVIEQSRWEDI